MPRPTTERYGWYSQLAGAALAKWQCVAGVNDTIATLPRVVCLRRRLPTLEKGKILGHLNPIGCLGVDPRQRHHLRGIPMAQSSAKTTDFNRAFGDAKKQASGVADAVNEAAHDVYDQALDSAADVAGTAQTAARKAAGSFEQAIRNTIETQPYTAAAIALGIGWLLGRMHRPL
jgi:ElaB/YqjD/DUF883 family membrane-anchored ribosome-binding protein